MKSSNKIKQLLALVVFALLVAGLNYFDKAQLQDADTNDLPLVVDELGVAGSDVLIAEAFRAERSNVQLGGEGRIVRILPDDNKGSRHQRFLLELESGHTLLIAHNIDLAPRIDKAREGDQLEFYGEYEWNAKGGVIHWTHHDPRGKHVGGWLKHQGQVYQ